MIKYIKGDATKPIGDGPKMIIHVCNNQGGWGRGFVLAISKKWKQPEKSYRELCKVIDDPLGYVQKVKVEDNLWVVNMIAQKGYGKNNKNKHRTSEKDTEIPLQYNILEDCLKSVSELAKTFKCSIHMPKIGAGLAGGDWNKIEQIINKKLIGIDVYVYEL